MEVMNLKDIAYLDVSTVLLHQEKTHDIDQTDSELSYQLVTGSIALLDGGVVISRLRF
jgi:hypothetical protein